MTTNKPCTLSEIQYDERKCNHVVRDVAANGLCHIRQCDSTDLSHSHGEPLNVHKYDYMYNKLNPYYQTLEKGPVIPPENKLTWMEEEYMSTHVAMNTLEDQFYIHSLEDIYIQFPNEWQRFVNSEIDGWGSRGIVVFVY